jgi:hypothetical protein
MSTIILPPYNRVFDYRPRRGLLALKKLAQGHWGTVASVFALVAIIRKLMTAVYSIAKHRRPFVLPPIFTPAAGGAVGPST